MNNEINGGDDGSRQKVTNSYVVFSYSSLTFFFNNGEFTTTLGGPTESASGSPGKTTPRPNTSGDALTEIYQLRLVGTGSNNFLPYRN